MFNILFQNPVVDFGELFVLFLPLRIRDEGWRVAATNTTPYIQACLRSCVCVRLTHTDSIRRTHGQLCVEHSKLCWHADAVAQDYAPLVRNLPRKNVYEYVTDVYTCRLSTHTEICRVCEMLALSQGRNQRHRTAISCVCTCVRVCVRRDLEQE